MTTHHSPPPPIKNILKQNKPKNAIQLVIDGITFSLDNTYDL